jgi:hypothetical protein
MIDLAILDRIVTLLMARAQSSSERPKELVFTISNSDRMGRYSEKRNVTVSVGKHTARMQKVYTASDGSSKTDKFMCVNTGDIDKLVSFCREYPNYRNVECTVGVILEKGINEATFFRINFRKHEEVDLLFYRLRIPTPLNTVLSAEELSVWNLRVKILCSMQDPPRQYQTNSSMYAFLELWFDTLGHKEKDRFTGFMYLEISKLNSPQLSQGVMPDSACDIIFKYRIDNSLIVF